MEMEERLLKRYVYGRLEGDIETLVVDSIANCVLTKNSGRCRKEDLALECDLCSSFGFFFRPS
jgi:hypothetical protein